MSSRRSVSALLIISACSLGLLLAQPAPRPFTHLAVWALDGLGAPLRATSIRFVDKAGEHLAQGITSSDGHWQISGPELAAISPTQVVEIVLSDGTRCAAPLPRELFGADPPRRTLILLAHQGSLSICWVEGASDDLDPSARRLLHLHASAYRLAPDEANERQR